MKIKHTIILITLISAASVRVFAQSRFERLGTQAFMNSNYKTAIINLNKANNAQPDNTNVLKMLGYSYFQSGEYQNAITAYSKLISLKPTDYSSFYYRGKAQLNIANMPEEQNNPQRDELYSDAIGNFTRALELSGQQDPQILQNRGIAYKDYGIYKSYMIRKKIEKKACFALLNNAIKDFQEIRNKQPLRKDIILLIDYVKQQIRSLK